MAKIRVSKCFTLDMAHALDGYNGRCRFIHGHTYHLKITVLGPVLSKFGDPNNGFVMDFNILKSLVTVGIIEHFDHALVLHKKSPYLESEYYNLNQQRTILTDFQPTCENILLHFVSIIQKRLPDEVQLVAVRLDETPSSFAEWLIEDQA